MPNKQKMQNYDYFDILDFKDPTPRSRSVLFRIAIQKKFAIDPIANSNT